MKHPPSKSQIEMLEKQLKVKAEEIEMAIQAGRIFEEVKVIYLEKKRIAEWIGELRQLQSMMT